MQGLPKFEVTGGLVSGTVSPFEKGRALDVLLIRPYRRNLGGKSPWTDQIDSGSKPQYHPLGAVVIAQIDELVPAATRMHG